MTKLMVAGLPICVDSGDKAFFARRFADYLRQDDREPVMTMRTLLTERVERPIGETVQQVEDATVVRLADGRFCRYVSNGQGALPFAVYYDAAYSRVELQFSTRFKHSTLSLTELEYVYTGLMFHNRLVRLGGGVLHSSSLAFRGQGVAFSANSGTGKSTHVGLWKRRYGDAVTVVNDDKPAICFEEDKPILWGNPWSGKTDLNCNVRVPLRAVVFIERGLENRLRRLDEVEAFTRLMEQIAVPYYDESLGAGGVELAGRLVDTVPVYVLNCSISQAAVDAVYDEIFAQEASV